MEAHSIADLLAAYERTALRWAELQPDASAANKVFDENHSIYKTLRDDEEGRRGISHLMGHESESVRVAAATHSLAWEPERASAVLETIERESSGPPRRGREVDPPVVSERHAQPGLVTDSLAWASVRE